MRVTWTVIVKVQGWDKLAKLTTVIDLESTLRVIVKAHCSQH